MKAAYTYMVNTPHLAASRDSQICILRSLVHVCCVWVYNIIVCVCMKHDLLLLLLLSMCRVDRQPCMLQLNMVTPTLLTTC